MNVAFRNDPRKGRRDAQVSFHVLKRLHTSARGLGGFVERAHLGLRGIHGLLRDEQVVAGDHTRFTTVAKEHGSFDRYAWSFVGGRPKRNAWKAMGDIPAETGESRALSKDLIKRGANFVGPTICYAFMQATGLVNDHLVSCFRYRQLSS